jgi:hypothetical protein
MRSIVVIQDRRPPATRGALARGTLWEPVPPPTAQRRWLVAGGALLALAAMPHEGRAQVINDYLEPAIQGDATQPGVTVASRQHVDYDPTGVRLGLLTVLPTLDESVGYDSDVTATTAARGSVLIDTTAKVIATSKRPDDTSTLADTSFNAVATLANFEYPDIANQSYTDWSAGVNGTHAFGQDTLFVSASHQNTNQTARDIDVPELNGPIAYRVNDLQASYAVSLGQLVIKPGMDLSWYSYDNGRVLGAPYYQAYRDRTVYYPSIIAKYELSPRRQLLLVVRDANASYTNAAASAQAGLPLQNFNDVSVLAGITYDLDGVIDFRLLGGYQQRQFSSHQYRTIRAPIVEGATTWTPTELTTVTGTVARYITDTSAEGNAAETITSFRLNIDHELKRNVILTAMAAFASAAYVGQSSRQLYSVGAIASWRLSRTLRLELADMFSSRRVGDSDVFAPTSPPGFGIGQSYNENVFRLRIRLAL